MINDGVHFDLNEVLGESEKVGKMHCEERDSIVVDCGLEVKMRLVTYFESNL